MSDNKDLFLYGGLAIGAYFIVKGLTDPLKKPIDAASDVLTSGIQTVGEAPQTLFTAGSNTRKNVYNDYTTITSGITASKDLFKTPKQNLSSSAAVSKMGMTPQAAQTFYKSIQNPLLKSSVTTQPQKVKSSIKTMAKIAISPPIYAASKVYTGVSSAIKSTGLFKKK